MVSADVKLTDWIALVRAEYLELPGLKLTRVQMARLWELQPDIRDAVLDDLVASRFLVETPEGQYRRPQDPWGGLTS